VSISGPHADWINPDLAIIDPETAERITRADGAERWARLQPFAYRNGDLHIKQDDLQPSHLAALELGSLARDGLPR